MIKETNETSKSIIVIGVLFAVMTLSAFIPAKWLGVKPIQHARLDLNSIQEINDLSLDKDSNGRPDWKDLVNATFTESDSDEVIKEVPIDKDAQKRLDDPNNLTASFSKNLYVASSYLKQNGGADVESQQDLINTILDQEKDKLTHHFYTNTDLRVGTSETASAIRIYGNSLGLLMEKSLTYKIGVGDITIMKAYTDNKDSSVLASLVIKKDHTDELIQSMLKLSVPKSATPYHLLTLNRLVAYRDLIDNMTQVVDDPIRATIAFNSYLETTDSLLHSLSGFLSYFTTQKITFSSQESGYVFEPGYTIKK